MTAMDRTRFKLFLRFFKFILPYQKKWLAILILSGLGTLLSLINPYLTKLVVDDAIGNRNLRIFIILILIGGGVFLLNGLFNGLRQFLDRHIKLRVNFDLNKKVFKHIEHLSYSWFQNKSTGEHIYKITDDIERVKDFITTTSPQAISLFPKILFILAVVFYINWKMAIFSLCLTPFLYLPSYYFSKKMQKVWTILIENYENVFKNLQETFSHIQLVKVFGKETTSVRKYLKKLINNIRIRFKNVRLEIFSSFTAEWVSKIIIGLIAFYGGYQVIKGQMTLGSLTAIMVYLRQLVGLQSQLACFFQNTMLGLISCQRLAEILDEKPQIVEFKNTEKVIFKKGEMLFENVSFGYTPEKHVLKNFDFRIEGGSHIAFVGPSGCGKTTVVQLFLRLYEPWKGKIFIDLYNIKDVKINSLKGQIGVVTQEPFLWNDSIENNIRYGKGDALFDEVKEATRIVCINDFINSLPQGYNTIIGENACKISEGQKQRIAIARAVIKKPRILILDEALSSVDAETEGRIINNIIDSFNNSTIMVISHRFSTIKRMDLVYFLNHPDKIDIGTHEELLERNSKYQHYLAHQVEEKEIVIDRVNG